MGRFDDKLNFEKLILLTHDVGSALRTRTHTLSLSLTHSLTLSRARARSLSQDQTSHEAKLMPKQNIPSSVVAGCAGCQVRRLFSKGFQGKTKRNLTFGAGHAVAARDTARDHTVTAKPNPQP